MSAASSGIGCSGHSDERGWLDGDAGDAPDQLPNVIAEVTASAAQWNFRIDQLLAHLDAVTDTIDFLEDRDVRIALRRALKQKRSELQRVGRELTLQVRTLSRFSAVVRAA